MAKKTKMTLPLLVTKELVVLPGSMTSIEATRSFSKAAIDASRDELSSLILITSQINPAEAEVTSESVHKIGTLSRILSYNKKETHYRIRVSSTSKVQITDIRFENGTFVADAYVVDETITDEASQLELVNKITAILESHIEIASLISKADTNRLSKGTTGVELAYIVANALKLPHSKAQQLLEAESVINKLEIIYEALADQAKSIEIERTLNKAVNESARKNQEEYFLREKLKAIKKELSKYEGEDASESILDKLENNDYPEHIKAKVKSEHKRYEMMPQASLESSLIKQYMDTLLAVPWYQETEDNDDISHAEKILNEDHFGLEKAKQRIIEYLAVKKMTGNLKAPILCFYGPPGVGKTSLGISIARALGRKFFKASLGGISDEAEIRGHRRTYVGSMPGRIISGMKKCGVVNPVFLLDEIDKLGSSQKGDPASAMLEVLDPEQNNIFNDNYLEEPYDLSKVLFIATANYLENIPGPLRDRLELIELNSYTEHEKLEIAKKFLIRKELKANGLENSAITITDEAIMFVIQNYTREAGVRELQRRIASIIRKVIVEMLKKDDMSHMTVSVDEVKEFLGKEIFSNSNKENEDQVGVITGLAYTQFGGDILPIEINNFPGKGNLVLTGKLGDVMKESASIALDYVKANAEKYNIDETMFAKNDIHIHVPEGAVPKDGPSAGVAITTALISSFTNKPISSNVAMTGEVTLRGKALPIGGLREKSLAALRSGIKSIMIPKENEKDAVELPKEVLDKLTIEYMTCVDDAVRFAMK